MSFVAKKTLASYVEKNIPIQNVIPVNIEWNAIIYGDGKFIAFDDVYQSAYSIDGITWTKGNNTTFIVIAAAYGNGIYVAMGTNRIAASEDGINWIDIRTDGLGDCLDIAYGNGIFVITQKNWGPRYTSSNGVIWNANIARMIGFNDPGIFDYSSKIIYANGSFYALSRKGRTAYSFNGSVWFLNTDSIYIGDSTSRVWLSVAYGNGRYVATSNQTVTAYSYAGNSWNIVPIAKIYPPSMNVKYGNGVFCILNHVYSIDGITWNNILPENPDNLINGLYQQRLIEYGNGKFVVLGFGENSTYSSDGINWSLSRLICYDSFTSIACDNNNNIHVAVSGGKFCGRSNDGLTWDVFEMLFNAVNVVYLNNRFIAWDIDGSAMFSLDGITWQSLPVFPASFNSMTYGNGIYIASKEGGGIYSSTNLTGFYKVLNHATVQVLFGNGRFVAIGAKAEFPYTETQFQYSTNGINWNVAIGPPPGINVAFGGWKCGAFGNGRFVAIRTQATVITWSDDGINWSSGETATMGYWKSMTHGCDEFIAVGQGAIIFGGDSNRVGQQGVVQTSTDGITWVRRAVGNFYFSDGKNGVTFSAIRNRFFAVNATNKLFEVRC